MDPYIDRVTCHVCGGEGRAWAGTGYKAWLGEQFRHSDSSVCAMYIQRAKAEATKKLLGADVAEAIVFVLEDDG